MFDMETTRACWSCGTQAVVMEMAPRETDVVSRKTEVLIEHRRADGEICPASGYGALPQEKT